jgi:hypothetical protein
LKLGGSQSTPLPRDQVVISGAVHVDLAVFVTAVAQAALAAQSNLVVQQQPAVVVIGADAARQSFDE